MVESQLFIELSNFRNRFEYKQSIDFQPSILITKIISHNLVSEIHKSCRILDILYLFPTM